MNNVLVFTLVFLLLSACASVNQSKQIPAPHNNFKGLYTEMHFNSEDPNDYMMQSCKIYGGLNQDSIAKIDNDLLLQDVYEYQCNFANKLKEELDIDGRSSKRLNGTIAKKKCEKLGFKVGSESFSNCLEELTQ
jgi:uncharacterized protein YceK